jgi:hypothetical protein
MTIHIQKFVDRVRAAEARGMKDLTMTLQEAKDLHADVTRLLLNLQAWQENQQKNTAQDANIQVQITGGNFR